MINVEFFITLKVSRLPENSNKNFSELYILASSIFWYRTKLRNRYNIGIIDLMKGVIDKMETY